MYTVPKLNDFSPPALEKAAANLIAACETESASVTNDADFKNFRDRWMARKNGILTQVNDLWLKAAPKEAKKDVGACVTDLKQRVEGIVNLAGFRSSVKLGTLRMGKSTEGV